jgi:hypothetical protein
LVLLGYGLWSSGPGQPPSAAPAAPSRVVSWEPPTAARTDARIRETAESTATARRFLTEASDLAGQGKRRLAIARLEGCPPAPAGTDIPRLVAEKLAALRSAPETPEDELADLTGRLRTSAAPHLWREAKDTLNRLLARAADWRAMKAEEISIERRRVLAATVLVHLAGVHAAAGRADEAVDMLGEAAAFGWTDWRTLEGMAVFDRLREGGRLAAALDGFKMETAEPRRSLGIQGLEATDEECEAAGLKVFSGAIRVTAITPNSAAEMAGIHVGDLLFRLDGTFINRLASMVALRKALHRIEPGRDYPLEVRRDGRSMRLTARWER